MSVKDLLLFSGELLKRLHESGIRIDDYKYVQLLKDYEELKSEGNKQTYMVAMLSHRYGICERKIYKLLARMRKACRIALGVNSGFTYSNSELRMSLIVVSDATDESQWWDTLVHEIDHVQSAICDYYDVPLGMEAAAWTQGYIMRQIIRTAHP